MTLWCATGYRNNKEYESHKLCVKIYQNECFSHIFQENHTYIPQVKSIMEHKRIPCFSNSTEAFKSTDEFDTLCQKTVALAKVNEAIYKELLFAKKCEVITEIQHSLCFKKDGNEDDSCKGQTNWDIDTKTKTETAEDRFTRWRYSREPLSKIGLIDLRGDIRENQFEDGSQKSFFLYENKLPLLKKYQDVEKANTRILLLAQKCKIAKDTSRTRSALRAMLNNLELIQVALGDLHNMLTVDTKNTFDANEWGMEDFKACNKKEERIVACLDQIKNAFNELLGLVPDTSISLRARYVERSSGESDLVPNILRENHQYGFNSVQSIFASTAPYAYIPNIERMNCFIFKERNGANLNVVEEYRDGSSHILIWNENENIVLWDIKKDSLYCKISTGNCQIITCIALYDWKGSKYLVSGSIDRLMKVWRISEQGAKCVKVLENGYPHLPVKLSIYYKDDNTDNGNPGEINTSKKIPFLASLDRMGLIHIWDLTTHRHVKKLSHINDFFFYQPGVGDFQVFYMNDENKTPYLISGMNTLQVWNLDTFELVKNIEELPDRNNIYSMILFQRNVLDNSKMMLVTGMGNGCVHFWHLEDKNHPNIELKLLCRRRLSKENECITSLAIIEGHDGNKYIVSGSADKTINVWNIRGHDDLYYSDVQLMRSLNAPGRIISMKSFDYEDRGCIVSVDSKNNVVLWSDELE